MRPLALLARFRNGPLFLTTAEFLCEGHYQPATAGMVVSQSGWSTRARKQLRQVSSVLSIQLVLPSKQGYIVNTMATEQAVTCLLS